MIATDVVRALLRHKQSMTLYSQGGYTENAAGEKVQNPFTPTEIEWPSTTISARQLNLDSSGKYTTSSRNFYQIGNAVNVQEGDEFGLNGFYYVVKDIKDLMNAGGFIRYICNLKVPNQPPEVI